MQFSLVSKAGPPVGFAIAGAVAFAWTVGPGAWSVFILIFCLGVLAILTLMAVPVLFGPFRREDSDTDRWLALVWLAAFWVVPIGGYALIYPMSVGGVVAARSFAADMRPLLETFRFTHGRYPAEISALAFWDLRRLFLAYDTDEPGRDYRFMYRDPVVGGLEHHCTNKCPDWKQQRIED